jgi:hypothetical protein
MDYCDALSNIFSTFTNRQTIHLPRQLFPKGYADRLDDSHLCQLLKKMSRNDLQLYPIFIHFCLTHYGHLLHTCFNVYF